MTPLPYKRIGPQITKKPLPTFIYFSLNAEESLLLSPFNQPAQEVVKQGFATLSFTLPGHTPPFTKETALKHWAEELEKGNDFIKTFCDQALESLHILEKQGVICLNQLALGGLSRGAFLATHLSTYLPKVHALIGFAPLTDLRGHKDFTHLSDLEKFSISSISEKLLHIHNLRFYIANNDLLVGTDSCYQAIRKLTLLAAEKRIRACQPELRLTPAIGRAGHGTAHETFIEGAQWIAQHLKTLATP